VAPTDAVDHVTGGTTGSLAGREDRRAARPGACHLAAFRPARSAVRVTKGYRTRHTDLSDPKVVVRNLCPRAAERPA
jgi:hypothetical protein